jgi:hypothetical protein
LKSAVIAGRTARCAYMLRASSALGYTSWDDDCTREFGTTRLRLPREERGEVVASLRESGLSIRAIASATGIDKNTVQTDLSHGDVAQWVVNKTAVQSCFYAGQQRARVYGPGRFESCRGHNSAAT